MKVPVEIRPVRVPGFRFAGVRAGIKASGKRDVAVLFSEVPAVAAAAFTTNRVQAAPVKLGIERAAAGRLQAIVVNSGNANAYTGRDGLKVARHMCAVAAKELRIDAKLVIPSSTGRIGVPLPVDKVEDGVRAACRVLSPDGFQDALEAIMTTDAFPKFGSESIVVDGREIVVGGMAKGAGMIAPRMKQQGLPKHATMLAYLMTDAAVTPAALRRALDIGLAESFNAVLVDGDTSTNDTLVLLANGVAGNTPITPRSKGFPEFCGAVGRLMEQLARALIKDGEGATKVVDIRVRGAKSVRDAERAAEAIARSPLCKTAFFGSDPNMGRVICALGYSGADFDPDRIDVFLDDLQIVRRGQELTSGIEKQAHAKMCAEEFTLSIDLRAGSAVARRVTSDLSVEYVHFNSAYST
jgi:glutamate N-acetyltransferase/amino-acid N-acetyltransferase